MPLPLILGIGAAIAGAAGVGTGIHGGVKLKKANDTINDAKERHEKNIANFKKNQESATKAMDDLGKLELQILNSFEKFSQIMEKIHNKPEFKPYSKNGVELPKYAPEDLKKASAGAGVLLGGLGGAAVGTAGGFAAAGATTAAVMALGTASTGTAIASLSGIAATNATIAAIGGGALAAGGGGIALGTTILGAATLGVGLLVGGVIFSITGSSISGKADEAWAQMLKNEKEIDKICEYLSRLKKAAMRYEAAIHQINNIYEGSLNVISVVVNDMKNTDWNNFGAYEKSVTQELQICVGILYHMCKVQLVIASGNATEANRVNDSGISWAIDEADGFIRNREPLHSF